LIICGKVVFLFPSIGGVRGGFSFKVLWHVGKSVIMQIITHESNHNKYDDTSKEIRKNQNEDSQKESY
jgi:hypothetical protein